MADKTEPHKNALKAQLDGSRADRPLSAIGVKLPVSETHIYKGQTEAIGRSVRRTMPGNISAHGPKTPPEPLQPMTAQRNDKPRQPK